MAQISIFGVGFVGSVMGSCLAERGHDVTGVDIDESKHTFRGSFLTIGDAKHAILSTDISFICVDTPCQPNGSINLAAVRSVARSIGEALREKDEHVVVVRSTVIPGTTEDIIIPILEKESGKKAQVDFEVYYNPEFLREKTAIKDFNDPIITVIGSPHFYYSSILSSIYKDFKGVEKVMSIRSAEMVKYASNAFHALKVAFANEMGVISDAVGANKDVVADTLCLDTRLNISTAYMKPGEPFGGSCLPKDLKMLVFKLKELGLDLPLIQSILPSNEKIANLQLQLK